MPHEEGLTDELKHLLQDLRRRSPMASTLRELDIHFEGEAKARSKTLIGKNARKIDIRAASYNTNYALELVFEAKIIDSDGDIRNSYFGPQGLGCFTDPPEPYTVSPVGGLLAYTVCDT